MPCNWQSPVPSSGAELPVLSLSTALLPGAELSDGHRRVVIFIVSANTPLRNTPLLGSTMFELSQTPLLGSTRAWPSWMQLFVSIQFPIGERAWECTEHVLPVMHVVLMLGERKLIL